MVPHSIKRILYLYRKKSLIRELSLLSCMNENPRKIIGVIYFYITLVRYTDFFLPGHLAVKNFFQRKILGKLLLKKVMEIAKIKNEAICFVSSYFDHYKKFDFFKLVSTKLNIIAIIDLTCGELFIKEIKNSSINLIPSKSQLLHKNISEL